MTSTTITSYVRELSSSEKAHPPRDGRVMMILLTLFTIALICGVVYGIVQMEHSVDLMYHAR